MERDNLKSTMLAAAADEYGFWCWKSELADGELSELTAAAEELGLRVVIDRDGGDREAVYVRVAGLLARLQGGLA